MKKKYIFMLSIIIIIIIVLLFINKKYSRPNLSDSDHDSPENEERINSTIYKLQKIDNISDYYTLKSIVGKYYLYYSRAFSEENINEENEYYKSLYNMVSPKYLNKYNITLENFKNYLQEKKDFSVEIYNSFYTTNYNSSIYYLIVGVLRDEVTHNAEDFQLILSIDRNNETFEIYPEEYIKNDLNIDINNLNVNDEVVLDYDTPIDNRNNDNIFKFSKASYDEYAKELFDRVRTILLYDENKSYELLNKNNNSEFNTMDELHKYIEENRSKIYLLTYASYEVKYEDNKLVFVCYDINSEFAITVYTDSIMEFTYSFNLI